MDNNDILIRLRYALDIKDSDMIKIFELGGITVSKEELLKILANSYSEDSQNIINCDYHMLESFFNGFIIFKRGENKGADDQVVKPQFHIKDSKNVNNVMLKKIKIALALSSDDMLSIFELTDMKISKGELSAVFRKEGHRNYKECGDRYARNFLKGLSLKYRS